MECPSGPLHFLHVGRSHPCQMISGAIQADALIKYHACQLTDAVEWSKGMRWHLSKPQNLQGHIYVSAGKQVIELGPATY